MDDIQGLLLRIIYEYRYFALLLMLSLGMVGLPVPDEFVMAFSGFQVSLGRMGYSKTLLIAALGSFIGTNLSYWIGRRLGKPLLDRIAPYLHFNETKLSEVEVWFRRFGGKMIVVGYFFPGFRHFIAYFGGISKLKYLRYVTFSGMGAVLWTATFITMGMFLGIYWESTVMKIRHLLIPGGIFLGALLIIGYLYNVKKRAKT
ncbi:DedA family protein [Desulfosporosinus sp. SB140]|uniref:DedA family protein n=1 Tax=Desulfosporosinus paludis TaxID=3115649 RepID=UPI00388DEE59